ncbi:hypothetical protein [Pseudomonas arsenicoxydans]|uniref:Uncharacterized protein n=1 Tax=Pseudomonas arsenicoxydans TaxID=702115 RepID=A0A502GWB6_9PSED|nr:hypothetical protein [Pseudomonas arsenicoxydans]TPG65762.1 hypothetical protein EAH78_31335 [Pseudomonas arsenicoxydans]
MKKSVLAFLTVASMDAYAVNIPVVNMLELCTGYFQGEPQAVAAFDRLKANGDIDPVKMCAQVKASGELDKPKPEATARSFMAEIANVDPAQVRVLVDSVSTWTAIATATAPDGKTCSFSMIPPPAGAGYDGWLVGAMDCKKRGSGGISIIDLGATKQAEADADAKKAAAAAAKIKAVAAAEAAKAKAGQ